MSFHIDDGKLLVQYKKTKLNVLLDYNERL